MRPRIRRPQTREGQDRTDNRPAGNRPFEEKSGFRPRRTFGGNGERPSGRFSGPGRNNGRPGYDSGRSGVQGEGRDYRSGSGRNGEFHRDRKPGFKGGNDAHRANGGYRGKDGFRKDGFRKDGFRKDGFRKDGNRPFAGGERTPRRTRGFEHRIRSERPGMEVRSSVPNVSVPAKEDDGLVRLNKFIANSGICSRREADEYISAGLVTVNGQVVTEMGVKVNPAQDDIRFNGERLRGEKKVYVLLNKPKDFVTTTSDPHAEKNVMQLISRELCPERIFPVGRLDKSTTGVLLLTNDGELAEKLTHPSFQKKKIYQVTLDKNLKPEDMDRLVNGIDLEDGPAYADEVAYNGEDRSVVGVEIHSGRNRIVRRMFEALGYRVRKLDRVYFAGLTKKNLRRGQWRFLSDEEVTMLKLNFYE